MENFGDAASISGNASPEHLHSTKKYSQAGARNKN
jgi:hypothetical protein